MPIKKTLRNYKHNRFNTIARLERVNMLETRYNRLYNDSGFDSIPCEFINNESTTLDLVLLGDDYNCFVDRLI